MHFLRRGGLLLFYLLFSSRAADRSPLTLSDWVRRGVYHESIQYDWKSDHAYFLQQPRSCPASTDASVNILMLGDSVDRNLLDDGCDSMGETAELLEWGRDLSYLQAGKKWVQGGGVCKSRNFTWGYMNIYGSKKKGPYYQHFKNNPVDPYTDTEARIFQAIEQYKSALGVPDFVFYRADLWDLHVISASNFSLQEEKVYFEQYRENLNWAWETIRSMLPNSVLCTHTIPPILWEHGDKLFDEFMSNVRFVAAENEVVIFDWNQMLGRSDPHTYLRDKHHPDGRHSSSFARLVTGALSSWKCLNVTRPRFDLTGKIVSADNSLWFYIDPDTGVRHSIQTSANISHLPSYLSALEVLHLPPSQVADISQSPVMVPFLKEGSLVRMANEKDVYVIQGGKRCPIHDGRVFFAHGWSFDSVQVFTSKYPMALIPIGQMVV